LGKYVVERLDSLTDLTPELAQALITAGAPQRLIDLASKFPEFEIESLTEQFFTKREGLLALVQNLEKFPNVDQERLLAELENWRVYNEIFENLDSLTQIDRGELLKQTIEKGYSGGITAIIANLEKFDGLVDYQAFAVQLIEKGYANAVLDSLEKFKNIQGAELVDVLARFAPDSLVNCLDASALEKFEIDLPVLAETLIKRNKRGDLVAGNFLKFTGAEPQTIANLLLEAGNGKHLAMNLEKFAGIDINQAARRMLEDRESQYICANLEKFTGLDEKIKSEVLDDMVQYGNLEILIRNLSKFNGVTPEALAQKILENGAPFKVLQQLRLYLDLINDENREEMVKIGKQIIRRGLEEETITPEEIYIRAKDASYYGIGGKEIIEMLELDKYPQIPKTWEDVLTMLSFINASPDSLTGYQIVLTSDLRVGTVGYVNRGGIETIGSIREVFHQLLGKLDLGNLVARGLVKATPRGGDNVDIELIRNKALDLEAEDKPRLEIMHQMVHNYPGPKNLNVMRAYINFLNGSSVDEYNSYLSQIGEGEIWKPLEEADREELRHTLQLAQSIEQDLTVMYEPNPNTMKADLEKWKGTVELPELEVQADEIYDLFAKETPDDDLAALKKLSSLRASIAVAINELQGEARVQTYYFDINLEALGYTIFARMRERMDGDNLDNLEKIISLVEAGIAISLHDGYQTAETGRIASRVSAIEADFHAGKLNSDTRLGELRAAFDQWGDESARIIKGLEEVYKPSIKAGLLAKNETLPVQERLTDRELESRVVGVSSGLYRGTVLISLMTFSQEQSLGCRNKRG
jgi:5'-deoxynucleotidase YfbR-like HD superfamily hydrolase